MSTARRVENIHQTFVRLQIVRAIFYQRAASAEPSICFHGRKAESDPRCSRRRVLPSRRFQLLIDLNTVVVSFNLMRIFSV